MTTQYQGYIFFTVNINANQINSDDWVGGFNGETCVGSQLWDVGSCSNEICSLTLFGDDGPNLTEGTENYLHFGEIRNDSDSDW